MDYETGYLGARNLADNIVDAASSGKSVAGLGGARKRKSSADVGKYELEEDTVDENYGVLSVGSMSSLFEDIDVEELRAYLEKVDEEKPMRPVSRGDALNTDVGARLMVDLKEAYGLTSEQAAGFVGNLAHETGDFKFMQEIEPVVKGSRGGYGFAQWTASRRKNFEAWAEENDLDISSYEANLGFLKHEIDNTSEGRFMKNLRAAETVDDSARIVSEEYLRPGKPNMDSRIARAYGYMELN